MALPAMRARSRGGISPSPRSRGLWIFMTARVGRSGADEQGRNYRVRPDSAGAGFLSRISWAPDRTALQRNASRERSQPSAGFESSPVIPAELLPETRLLKEPFAEHRSG
jgi:hypothetical protein